MVYLLAIFSDESWVHHTAEEMARVMKGHKELEDEMRARGAFRGGAGLSPSDAAVTVRFGSGKPPLLTDGPFAETKELLGGFYLVEAETREEAIDYARRIPGVASRAIEVRPVMIYSAP
jgi:hypothetical protein